VTTIGFGHPWIHDGALCEDCGSLAVFRPETVATDMGAIVTVQATCPAAFDHRLNAETHRLLTELQGDR
jgi:hypothetical protein